MITAAKLARQFLAWNRPVFELLGIDAGLAFDGFEAELVLRSSSIIGAAPLRSLLSGGFDHGILIRPRFDWPTLGPMLGRMGWRVVPHLLPLPLLRRSERRMPPWVLSLIVLDRIERLIRTLERRFEFAEASLPAPKGTVRWQQYATQSLPRAAPHRVPCRFPDLRDDRLLRGAVRWTLEAHIRSLTTQLQHGAFVYQLVERAYGMRRLFVPRPGCFRAG